jgi:polyisoprenoid-binding protein YceI
MPSYEASSIECNVFTFKEGMLSAIAHDLKIRVTKIEVQVDDATKAITARADASSLEVLGAAADGAVREGVLSDSDKQKIQGNIADEVLETKKHPEVRFASKSVTPEGDGFRVAGELTLHGQTKAVNVLAKRVGDRLVAELPLNQPDFGIKPYSAMLGTLKVKPEVVVKVSVPAPR